jgi:DNA polymerase-1
MYVLISNEEQVREAIHHLLLSRELGADTETYGVGWNDRLFSAQLAGSEHTFYFNFHDYHDGTAVLNRSRTFGLLDRELFRNPDLIWYIHNAKFDLRRFAIEGCKAAGGVHCTQMNERFIHNQQMHYSFDACLKRRGMEKDDAVERYIKENSETCITRLRLPDGDTKVFKHYDKVPFPIMFEYGCSDAERVRILGSDQRKNLEVHAFYHNDLELEKVAYEMEEIGIACDVEYARKGLEHELQQAHTISNRLTDLAGEPFRNGPTWLRRIFDSHAVPYRTNPKTGNPVFDKSALDNIDHPIAGLIRKYRRHEKYASTYYSYYAEHELVHAFIKTWGTDTGRFSYAEPNLQNVPKEEKPDPVKDPVAYAEWLALPFPVRGCFKPRTPDHVFVMIDFDQQEFRLLLDYAGELELIRQINEQGLDVHQATADMVGITRKQAKTLNFALLYGMGDGKLARSLGVSLTEAKRIRALYFSRLPNVKKFIEQVIRKSERVGVIKTWCGRELKTPRPYWTEEDGVRKRLTFDYKMPNHLIQGGCGDIARFAMVQCYEALKPYPESNMLLQVHDELLFEFHKNDLHMVEVVRKIMENTYRPFNGMRLTCGVEHSWKSWSKKDVVEGAPCVEYA